MSQATSPSATRTHWPLNTSRNCIVGCAIMVSALALLILGSIGPFSSLVNTIVILSGAIIAFFTFIVLCASHLSLKGRNRQLLPSSPVEENKPNVSSAQRESSEDNPSTSSPFVPQLAPSSTASEVQTKKSFQSNVEPFATSSIQAKKPAIETKPPLDLSREIILGNAENVQFILNQGLPHSINHSLLFSAIVCNHCEIRYQMVRSLLAAGFSPNQINEFGHSPLSLAVIKKDFPLVKILVQSKADVNMETNLGFPLYLAWSMREENNDFFEYLIQHGADINTDLKIDSFTLLGRCLIPTCFDTKSFEYLLSLDAKINNPKISMTLIGIALSKNKGASVIEFLLDKGAEPDVNNLNIAYSRESKEIFNLLIKYLTKIPEARRREILNKPNCYTDELFLHEMIISGDWKTVRELFALGADVSLKGATSNNAYECAQMWCTNENPLTYEFLRS